MIALLIAGLLAQLAQPRAVTCPPRAWLEGIARSGVYRCYVTGGTVDDEHPPHTLVASGRLWCLPDEVPVLVDHRRARCRRGRRTPYQVSVRRETFDRLRRYALNRREAPIVVIDQLVRRALDQASMVELEPRRARPARRFQSTRSERDASRERRARLRTAGLCINGKSHGAATHGVLCARCRETHRRSA